MDKLGLSPAKKIILYIDQRLIQNRIFSKSEAYQYTRSIFCSILKILDTQLVVKLRAGSGKDVSLELANKVIQDIEGAGRVVITDKYLYELLAIADLVIIFSSTVGMEAILMDKSVMSVNFTNVEHYPYIESGAALGCRSPEQILPTIKQALFNQHTKRLLAKKRKEFIHEHLYKQDGQASKRIANLVIDMSRNRL